MDGRPSFPRYRLLVLLCTAAALSGTRSPAAAAGRSCADTRQVYAEKGYGTDTAPLTQISGKTKRLPHGGGQNYTRQFWVGFFLRGLLVQSSPTIIL